MLSSLPRCAVLLVTAGLTALLTPTPGRTDPAAFPLKVSANGRFLTDRNDAPFFYLADTAWELFHRCDRADAECYLRNRADKHFTVIQAVLLAELDGLTVPNPAGHLPLVDKDPTRPVEAYFMDVDAIVDRAEQLGLVIGLLPTWGDQWHNKRKGGSEIFTPENALVYGEFVGRRYKTKPIIWILGGDRSVDTPQHAAIIRALATGLHKGDGGRNLITFHPNGRGSSANWFQADPWLSFNMIQSGHDYNRPNYEWIARDYARTPMKPCTDGEPGYEDHPAGFKKENGYMNDYDVRKFAYWSLFAGAHGHTYGCHDVWQFYQPGREPVTFARTPWRQALDLPGAGQMQHARRLLEARPFLSRVPDQSLLASPAGTGTDHVQATRAADGSYALVYLAAGGAVTIDLGKLSGAKLRASWFDPRTGMATVIEEVDRTGSRGFTAPSNGPGHDWVLVLDDAATSYPALGK